MKPGELMHNNVLVLSIDTCGRALKSLTHQRYNEIVGVYDDATELWESIIIDAVVAEILKKVLSDHGRHVDFPVEIWKCDSDPHLKTVKETILPIIYTELYAVLNNSLLYRGSNKARLMVKGNTCIVISGDTK